MTKDQSCSRSQLLSEVCRWGKLAVRIERNIRGLRSGSMQVRPDYIQMDARWASFHCETGVVCWSGVMCDSRLGTKMVDGFLHFFRVNLSVPSFSSWGA